jgi:hypothetical protein
MSPRWSGPLNDRRISRLTSRTKTKGTLREQQPGHARPSTVTRLQSISRGCRIFVPGASLACPPILLRRSMVRRGSTVRVRQRALQKPRKSGVSLSDLLARNPVCSANGAVYGPFRFRTPTSHSSLQEHGAPRHADRPASVSGAGRRPRALEASRPGQRAGAARYARLVRNARTWRSAGSAARR